MDMTDLQADGAQDTEKLSESMSRSGEPRTDSIDEALQYALAFLNDPEGLASAREEWRYKVRDALKAYRAASAPLREALERLVDERIEERADDYGRDEESWEPMLSDAERQARAALTATPAPYWGSEEHAAFTAEGATPAPAPLDVDWRFEPETWLAQAMEYHYEQVTDDPHADTLVCAAKIIEWLEQKGARLTARAAVRPTGSETTADDDH